MNSTSHVFVIHGDITQFACDAWLLPTDCAGNVSDHWYKSLGIKRSTEIRFASDERAIFSDLLLPANSPLPIFTDVGGNQKTDRSWYLAGVRRFVEVALSAPRRSCSTNPQQFWRKRRLLALPLIGTGLGGQALKAGAVVQWLLPELKELATEFDVDLALVLKDSVQFHATQEVRRRICDDTYWQQCLGESLVQEAKRLARLASDRRLVVFVGAGVSSGAGLPTWNELLVQLCGDVGFSTEQLKELDNEELDVLDRAKVIERQLEILRQRNPTLTLSLGQLIAQKLEVHQWYSLGHALLAGLPISEAVTTNYDELFEKASKGCGTVVTTLPYAPSSETSRWLLKLHGCLSHPDDIVLTRSDYLRYDDRRAALRGIVQAMLMTRHMLFVGFSMKDDNFHRIAEDVRKAVHGPSSPKAKSPSFGTVISLRTRTWQTSLWKPDLDWVNMDQGASEVGDEPWRLEVFLDYLSLEATDCRGYLLDPRYRDLLSENEEDLCQRLNRLNDETPEEIKQTSAWKSIQQALMQLGLPSTPSKSSPLSSR